jgi:hypothetical protein
MRIARIVTSLAMVALAVTGAQYGASVGARADEGTISQNQLRDGWDSSEPGLSPAQVTSGKFGQLFATNVDGQVYAQPLVVDHPGGASTPPGTSVIVATENDTVYSLNGATGAVQWQTSVGTAWNSSVNACADLAPKVGITATPVYDPSTGMIYVMADNADGNPNTTDPEFDFVAINEETGAVQWRKAVQSHPTNDPTMTFDSEVERQRVGLLVASNGWIYTTFAGICNRGPYTGLVAGVDAASDGGSTTLWTTESGNASSTPWGGIWMSGGGLVQVPGQPDSVYLTTGNGAGPAPWSEGSPFPAQNNLQLADSVIRLDIQPDGSLQAGDFFSPANAPVLGELDRDLGSGGLIGLPTGTAAYPDLLLQAGKDGRVFLLNANSLGGRSATSDNALSVNGPYGGQWGHPAAFAGSDGKEYVYYSGTGYGAADYLRVLQLTGSSAAPALTEAGNSAMQFGFSSGSPVVTSTGTDPGTAVVWEVNAANINGANGTLEAFGAVPVNGILPEIWSAPVGTAAKFTTVATDGGRVYLGTRGTGATIGTGTVYGFGIKGGTPPFTGTGQATVPDAGVGGTASTRNVTLTATGDVTVTSLALSSGSTPFTLGTPLLNGTATSSPISASNPVSLTQGQTLTVPVTFSPATTGQATAQLQIATNVTGFTTVSVPLAGTGTSPGLSADPATLRFGANGTGDSNDPNTGPVPVGLSEPFPTAITNTGTTAVTVSSVTTSGPFTVTGVQPGDTLAPGTSEVATVTYAPATVNAAGTPAAGTFRVGFTDGTTSAVTTVALSGVSVAGQGTLAARPASASFGQVSLGKTASRAVTLTNSGNLPVTVTRFTAPGVPFGTPTPITSGVSINAGSSVSLPVTYAPQSLGASAGSYQVTVTDGRHPASTVTIPVSGTGAAAKSGVAVPAPGGGWRLNGDARMTGTALAVTPAWHSAAGSAVYYQPLASSGLRVTFHASLSGSVGGDGMTFALVRPGDTTAALGKGGGLLGFGGLHGIAVVLGTRKDAGFPSANFVGIATGTTGSGASAHLVFRATSTAVPNLRKGTHLIGIAVSGSGSTRSITVGVDGKQYLKTTVSLPASVLPAFTAGTAATTAELNRISGVSLTSAAGAVPPPGGGWSYNGSAQVSGTGFDTDLTTAVTNQAGTVIYPRAVATTATSSLTVQFQFQVGGGTGANALTFDLLSPKTATTAVGGTGPGLGVSGLSGMALTFATSPVLGTASSNFFAVVTLSGTSGLSVYTARDPVVQLRSGTHTAEVTLSGGRIVAYLDGGEVASVPAPSQASSLLAFSGSTGALTDMHAIRDVSVAASGW